MKTETTSLQYDPKDRERWERKALKEGYVYTSEIRRGEPKLNAWINDTLNKQCESKK